MPLPILSVAQVRDWEKRTWDAGISVESVIEQTGQAIARLATQVTQSGDAILLLAGKGNNGSDTRLAVEHLCDRQVHILNIERKLILDNIIFSQICHRQHVKVKVFVPFERFFLHREGMYDNFSWLFQ